MRAQYCFNLRKYIFLTLLINILLHFVCSIFYLILCSSTLYVALFYNIQPITLFCNIHYYTLISQFRNLFKQLSWLTQLIDIILHKWLLMDIAATIVNVFIRMYHLEPQTNSWYTHIQFPIPRTVRERYMPYVIGRRVCFRLVTKLSKH